MDKAVDSDKLDKLKEALERKNDLTVEMIKHRFMAPQKEAAQKNWKPMLALAGRGSKRLRQIVSQGINMGLLDLIPCWMMDPNTASQLFPLDEGTFRLVIFDEASQCPIEQAIPAIYRAKRLVVSGDDKQLPPTSFFQSSFDWEESEEENQARLAKAEELATEEEFEAEMYKWQEELAVKVEDLLEASKPLLPEAHLRIHYRSRYPELIEFSNRAFYGGQLEAPPNALSSEEELSKPIEFRFVRGVYEKQQNLLEAREIVGIVKKFLDSEENVPTIGIVTFNQVQSELIERELDRIAENDPAFGVRLESARQRVDDGLDVGLFVKNLENVQGDERDVMIFSTTFGRQLNGVFQRKFGPLNTRKDGPRRLNVAISRAREQKIIVTSMPIGDISPGLHAHSVGHNEPSGRDFLQLYMWYAEAIAKGDKTAAGNWLDLAGQLSAEPSPDHLGTPSDSPFEDEVCEKLQDRLHELQRRDLTLERQVGSQGFRIDIAVRQRDSLRYLLGIECDGATYHSTPTARFRDIWRQGILEQYGWRIHRVWSRDWWSDAVGEIDQIMELIDEIEA